MAILIAPPLEYNNHIVTINLNTCFPLYVKCLSDLLTWPLTMIFLFSHSPQISYHNNINI